MFSIFMMRFNIYNRDTSVKIFSYFLGEFYDLHAAIMVYPKSKVYITFTDKQRLNCIIFQDCFMPC